MDAVISIHALLAESDYWATRARAAQLNFYPRSPCGERPAPAALSPSSALISIHALLAESDVVHIAEHASPGGISIHALLAESDGAYRGARQSRRHFYPRSPCGERRAIGRWGTAWRDISIHALLAESDDTPNI